jgi:ABC-type ATPase involved in cell division
MILKALTLENFKGIREPVRIEFAPLTLLFGPNNAGKSTIVQALMYAREVFERKNCDAGRTQLGGDVIDLGGFANLVYGHDLSRVIRMRFDLDLRGPGNGLRDDPDWVRESKLDAMVGDTFRNAPKKLDFFAAGSAAKRLLDVWVEVEIAWSDAVRRPVIRTYSVGTNDETYATISYDDQRDEASLSYFNFGVYPFGTRYRIADASDFDWALACLVRDLFRHWINKQGLDGIVEKDARIGMSGEERTTTQRHLSRADFDTLVSDFINGTGSFPDDQPDMVRLRQNRIELAQEIARGRSTPAAEPEEWLGLELSEFLSIPSSPALSAAVQDYPDLESEQRTGQNEQHEPALFKSLDDAPDTAPAVSDSVAKESRDYCFEDRLWEWSGSSHYDDEEVDSWLLEFFVALIRRDYIPETQDCALPLTQHDSALPDWRRTIEIAGRCWRPDEPEWLEFWEYPAYAQEYLKDLLTTAIVGPGKQLLKALQNAIYLSPFREMPPRHYQPARSPEPRRWANGLAAWDSIMLRDKVFADAVNAWLSGKDRFNSGFAVDLRHYHELEVDSPLLCSGDEESEAGLSLSALRERLRQLPQGRRLQIRDLRDLRSGITLFPQDLGVGISQVLPVIVAALHSESGVVMIEEPESNIHPAFQVVLADLFITQAKANPDMLFLIETHSEHLMLRCLRRIRETSEGEVLDTEPSLKPEDIAVHFVEPGEGGPPSIHRIRINEDGEFLDPWPRGFFRERGKELFG